jgi:hypothetical protein
VTQLTTNNLQQTTKALDRALWCIILLIKMFLNINKNKKVLVATYTNEGLKFQMVLGPLKFEPSKRGRPTVTI